MRTCPSCGAVVSDEAKFCGQCGKETRSPEINRCRACGQEMKGTDKFCPVCGFGKAVGTTDDSPITPYAPAQEEPHKPYDQAPPNLYGPDPQFPKHDIRKCRNCGYVIPSGQNRCAYCGAMVVNNRSKDYAGIAGAIMILVGAINLVIYGMAALGSLLSDNSIVLVVSVILLTFANIFVIWAGMQAVKRKSYGLCVVASVISLLSLTFVVAPIGLLLLIMSKDAFSSSH